MHWMVTAAAERKIVDEDPYYIFGSAVQQISALNNSLAERFKSRNPHITLYGPGSARDILAAERINPETALREHGIDLAGNGGAQIVCDFATIFVSVYIGEKRFLDVAREVERTLDSARLAMSIAFSLPILWSARIKEAESAQDQFFSGQPMFTGLPDIQIVVRSAS